MLNYYYRIPLVCKLLQHSQESFYVCKMKARGGFVQNVQRVAGALAEQLRRQLHALALAAGKSNRALPQADVSQAHIFQGLQLGRDAGVLAEELVRFADAHLQHVVYVLALVVHRKRIFFVALAAADLAGHVHARQEVHLYLLDAGAFAFFAAASRHIEREAPGLEAADLGIRRVLEKGANVVEDSGEGGGIAPGRAPYGTLVHLDHLVDETVAH